MHGRENSHRTCGGFLKWHPNSWMVYNRKNLLINRWFRGTPISRNLHIPAFWTTTVQHLMGAMCGSDQCGKNIGNDDLTQRVSAKVSPAAFTKGCRLGSNFYLDSVYTGRSKHHHCCWAAIAKKNAHNIYIYNIYIWYMIYVCVTVNIDRSWSHLNVWLVYLGGT